MLFGESDLKTLSIAGYTGPFHLVGLALGKGANALEVVVMGAPARPTDAELRDAWRKRWGNRASPVLVVAVTKDRAHICGPSDPEPRIFHDVPLDVANRICLAAIEEPDRHAARRFLAGALGVLDAPLPGLRNGGLFATHHLRHNVPHRKDWGPSAAKAAPLLHLRDDALLAGLGFSVERTAGPFVVLRHGDSKVGLAVLVGRGTDVDAPSDRFGGLSPVSYGLAKADQENLPYVLVLEGPAVRLYATNPGVGAGRRGRTETYLEARLDLLPKDASGYLWLLFSAEALVRGGTVEEIIRESGDYAAGLGERLRDRIYKDVIPVLATGVAEAMQARHDVPQLRETYEVALTILFRLLFIAYGEDRHLLPYRTNEQYRVRSLKAKARELAAREGKSSWDQQSTYFGELLALFQAVDEGKAAWGVPAYNGGLFASDPLVSPRGSVIRDLDLPDSIMGPVLEGLLVDVSAEGRGPVDFRSLGVREFGTIYEGLLESDLAVADRDLVEDLDGVLRPVRSKRDVIGVAKGQVYLHNSSGARKATGSYFTKPVIVDHLLDQALEPALADHVARLDALDEGQASARFFDFRVVDLAMGSGHFLVAAIDRIERALSGYLAKRTLPRVSDELARLRKAVVEATLTVSGSVDVEDGQLLRRQIARRCIYGVDLNPISVELARLSIWIHTFVPGLPLSFLDHSLVRGNSLIGVATLDEAATALGGGGLFGAGIRKLLLAASTDLERLGRVSDADRAEIKEARAAAAAARKKIEPLAALFDHVVASRASDEIPRTFEALDADSALAEILRPGLRARVRKILEAAPPLHFPIVFPEVFLRERPGFDVILGNPPWEEVTVERDRFWGRHIPGLQGMKQGDREKLIKKAVRERDDLVAELTRDEAATEILRRILLGAGYPGMGTGDPDLYKAFVWRFWNLTAQDGRIGVVLPRVVFQAKGSADFRRELFAKGEFSDLTFLQNTGGWVFEAVHQQYTIALATLRRAVVPGGQVPLRGPYVSLARFLAKKPEDGARFAKKEIMGWTDTAALPMLPTEQSGEVFAKLRRAPRLDVNERLDEWRARPYAEFHATNDKINGKQGFIDVMSDVCPKGFWPVLKGESFDIWEPDTGTYYGFADPDKALPEIERRRAEGMSRQNSPFVEFRGDRARASGISTLPCQHPRIAFRDVTRSTDTRTVRVALVPPKVFLTNKAPYLLFPRGDDRDTAYLLGVLSSRPLDWYARRFVEISMNYHVFNPFPVPRPPRESTLWERVVALAGRLASPDRRFARFAKGVGVDHGVLSTDAKADMVCELDALVAHLFGLNARDVRHIFETFHEGWEFEADLMATLAHFEKWRKKGIA